MRRFERNACDKPGDVDGSSGTSSSPKLRTSTSMIELRELADIRAFDEAMQAIVAASSSPPSSSAAKNISGNAGNDIANDNAGDVIVANESADGGFFIGGDDDDEDNPICDTSYVIEERRGKLNDGNDDDDYHHAFPRPLIRSHSLAAIRDSTATSTTAASTSGCSTTTRRSSFIPGFDSICEGDEEARRNSMEHTGSTLASTSTSNLLPITKQSEGSGSSDTIATANKSKPAQQPSSSNTIKKSTSLLSLISLGGRSTDGDDDATDGASVCSGKGRSTRRSKRGNFANVKSSLKKSTSMSSLRTGFKNKNNEEDELAASLNSSLHSFSSNHDPFAKPAKSAMKCRSMSLCALDQYGNDSQRTDGTIDSSSSETAEVLMKRNVSFHKLEIREYGVVLGDNPSCSSGPPVQLAWDPHDSTEIQIDVYEEHRPPRRDRSEMLMTYNVRWWRLMRESGYTVSHLKRATDACQEARRARTRTLRKVRRQEKFNDTIATPLRSLKKLSASAAAS